VRVEFSRNLLEDSWRYIAKAPEREFLVKRISLLTRDSRELRKKRDWPKVSSSRVASVAYILPVSLTLHERRFTPKSGESAMAAEAFMDLAGLNTLTAYQRCVIPTALAHRLGS
jgi:hypothetical protein